MKITPVLVIDLTGVIVGLISVVKMMNLNQTLGGRMRGAISLVVGGVALNILAFAWTVVFIRLKLLPAPALDMHHLFMTIGMVLFVLAAYKFSTLMKF